ncbi:hypothetical protein GQ42DRAFT_165492 [Ramicandelaber brevisporus]|nr:hypothetical protein GQ42DRAFT_165492 [Ramicandelaber brevisporus]
MPCTATPTPASAVDRLPPWLHIRRAVPDDAVAITKVVQHTWMNAFAHFVSQSAVDSVPAMYDVMVADRRRALERIAAIPPHQRDEELFVAVGTPPQTTTAPVAGGTHWDDGAHERVVGFLHMITLKPDTPRIDFVRDDVLAADSRMSEVYTLHCVPEAQGTGLALALMALGAQWTRDVLGSHKMMLWTVQQNTKARAFYERKTDARQIGELGIPFLGQTVDGVNYTWTPDAFSRLAALA